MVPVGALVPRQLREDFKAAAKKHDRSFSGELRQAMTAHIDASEREDNKANAA